MAKLTKLSEREREYKVGTYHMGKQGSEEIQNYFAQWLYNNTLVFSTPYFQLHAVLVLGRCNEWFNKKVLAPGTNHLSFLINIGDLKSEYFLSRITEKIEATCFQFHPIQHSLI